MSRKTRAEKVPLAQPPPVTQTEDLQDSVDPETLTKSEILNTIAQEEGEEIVSDILDGLMAHVMKRCHEAYLKKQVINFSGNVTNPQREVEGTAESLF